MTIKLFCSAADLTRRMATGALLLCAMACASCSMNLNSQPQADAQSIAGNWQLQSPARQTMVDNLRSLLDQAHAKEMERERRRYPRGYPPYDGPDAPIPVEGASAGEPMRGPMRRGWEIRDQREQQEALLNAVLPGNKLQITQLANRVEVQADTGARRRFEAGASITQVTTYATFKIESGWQKNVFVVHARDSDRRIDVIQRYQRSGANALRMQVQLNVSGIPEQMISAEYALQP